MASSASAALHNLAIEYSIDPATIIARPAPRATAVSAAAPASQTEASSVETRMATKHPHSLAATLAMPHDRVFGDVVTAFAQREKVCGDSMFLNRNDASLVFYHDCRPYGPCTPHNLPAAEAGSNQEYRFHLLLLLLLPLL